MGGEGDALKGAEEQYESNPAQWEPASQSEAERLSATHFQIAEQTAKHLAGGDPDQQLTNLGRAYLALQAQVEQLKEWAEQQIKRGDNEQIARKAAQAQVEQGAKREAALREIGEQILDATRKKEWAVQAGAMLRLEAALSEQSEPQEEGR